ncbi:hypothetical protein ACIQC9_13470 [Brevundimonas sp. NPDC092305]|uniref:hypothetical protein n=1 Tax=Brevundimonas sp. NPDC092305 TaxID=3363957 RepID=UPI00380B2556
MGPYTLTVFSAGSVSPVEIAHVNRAPEVLAKITELLEKHKGCERIRIDTVTAHLFTVDCHGDRVED